MDFLFELSENVLKASPLEFRRYLFGRIPADQRLVVLKGARGVGKTTLLLQLLHSAKGERHEKIYLSLDHIYFLNNGLFAVADRFRKLGGRVMFLDEVHRYPGWAAEIKNIYDHFSDLHVFVTGSSALDITKGAADLGRRALVFTLNELSFREYLDLSGYDQKRVCTLQEIQQDHVEIGSEISRRIRPLRLFREYLSHGTYPFFIEGNDHFHQRLRGAINSIIETDLPSLENISYHSVVQIKKLLFVLSESVPFTPNISELARKMALSRDVLLKLLYLLEKAGLIYQLRRETRGISYLTKPEKIYLHNTGIAHALSTGHPDTGNLRETFLLNQLSVKHSVTWTPQGDFCIDGRIIVEVGGRKKGNAQIEGLANALIAADDIETGHGNKIPLWLFGFLY